MLNRLVVVVFCWIAGALGVTIIAATVASAITLWKDLIDEWRGRW